MNSRFSLLVTLTIASGGLPLIANANPELCVATGNYYEVVAAPAISWDAARLAAQARTHNGVFGDLATATSAAEDACVDELRAAVFDTTGPAQAWLGGFQATGAGEPGLGWQWINSEGVIPGTDNPASPYANWADQEPNDLVGAEQHLASGRFGLGLGWNDEGTAPQSILGYIVEYDNTATAQNCLEGPDGVGGMFGCNITGGMNLELLQDSNLQGGEIITQNYLRPDAEKIGANVDPAVAALCTGEFAFPDPRVDVNGRVNGPLVALDVFAQLGGGPAEELILDRHTYGSPCFAVIAGGANFELVDTLPTSGPTSVVVATTTQIPEAVPGIGPTFQCFGEGTNDDLQTSAQSTYQTDDRGLMVELSAAAMTNFCNSPSRGATFKFSYYVLNTHEDCGLNIDVDGADAVAECFQDLAVAKFDALDTALTNAADNLGHPKFSKLSSKLNQARSMIKTGQYSKAEARLLELLDLVNGSTWNADSDNDPGNLVMRITNLLYRIDQLQQAETF